MRFILYIIFFLAINCSAFSDSLLESRLFGYKKGAFFKVFKYETLHDSNFVIEVYLMNLSEFVKFSNLTYTYSIIESMKTYDKYNTLKKINKKLKYYHRAGQ